MPRGLRERATPSDINISIMETQQQQLRRMTLVVTGQARRRSKSQSFQRDKIGVTWKDRCSRAITLPISRHLTLLTVINFKQLLPRVYRQALQHTSCLAGPMLYVQNSIWTATTIQHKKNNRNSCAHHSKQSSARRMYIAARKSLGLTCYGKASLTAGLCIARQPDNDPYPHDRKSLWGYPLPIATLQRNKTPKRWDGN